MIENIFGWAMICFMLLRVFSFVYFGYIILRDFAKGNITFSPVFPLFINVLELWIMANSCEKCVKTSNSIASLALSINLKPFHNLIGDFALQMLHQKIKFEPKRFFVVNHELIVTVSRVFYE
jgi:7tm Chemosensory receptor